MAAERPIPLSASEADGLFADLKCEDGLALAVSGGADSLGLALLVAQWRARNALPVRLHALVVDHGLRAGSDMEAGHASANLERLGIASSVLTLSGLPRQNLHAAARLARYDAMSGWMARHGFSTLATAHHRDDQAETVVMRMRRSETAGIAGIPRRGWWADVRVVRPLLDVPRARIAACLAGTGIEPVRDPSNADMRFERARVRHDLARGASTMSIPRLLARAEAARAQESELDRQAAELAAQAVELLPMGCAIVDLGAYAGAQDGIRRWLLRSLVRDLGGRSVPASRDKLLRLDGLLADCGRNTVGQGFAGATLGGVRFVPAIGKAGRGRVVVSREAGRGAAPDLALSARLVALFDRRFRVSCGADVEPGLRIALAGERYRRFAADHAESDGRVLPAAAFCGVPLLFSGAEPVAAAWAMDGERLGVLARGLGFRLGENRIACQALTG